MAWWSLWEGKMNTVSLATSSPHTLTTRIRNAALETCGAPSLFKQHGHRAACASAHVSHQGVRGTSCVLATVAGYSGCLGGGCPGRASLAALSRGTHGSHCQGTQVFHGCARLHADSRHECESYELDLAPRGLRRAHCHVPRFSCLCGGPVCGGGCPRGFKETTSIW